MDDKVKPDLLIGDLARESGASPRSLRHYEQRGLLSAGRTASGYRVYVASDVERVRRIKSLLAAGFSLDAVAVVLPCLDESGAVGMCPTVAAEVKRLVGRLDDEAADLRRRRDQIEALVGVDVS